MQPPLQEGKLVQFSDLVGRWVRDKEASSRPPGFLSSMIEKTMASVPETEHSVGAGFVGK